MIKRRLLNILIIMGLGALSISCNSDDKSRACEAEVILKSIVNQSRFFSTDQIAKRVIVGDPSMILIDVRSLYDFEEYSIPGAMNIPSEELLLDENKSHFSKGVYDVVLYSNDDIYSDQAWYFLTKQGYTNIYVMKGGLNAWFSTIMLPEEPMQGSPEREYELYSFRKGASIYFGGSQPEIPKVESSKKEEAKPSKKKKVQLKKKVKKQAEGGC